MLAWLGLPVAFLLNTVSYLVAAATLWSLPGLGHQPGAGGGGLTPAAILSDLRAGVSYLAQQRAILYPLLLTLLTIMLAGPVAAVLPAVVHARGGSIVDLGMLGAAMSVGSLAGAAFAGARSEGANATRRYAAMGMFAALAVALFVWMPTGVVPLVSLAVIGFVAFAEAVWNTSRIRRVADAAYQARLQAITSMAFTLGFTLGTLWAGAAIDRVGHVALLWGAAALVLCSAATVVFVRRGSPIGAQSEEMAVR